MATSDPRHDERRRFIRHPTCVPLRCRKQGQAAGDPRVLRDISLGGLRFASPDAYAPGDILLIEFPTLLHTPGELCGEVIWTGTEDGGPPPMYATGLRFMQTASFLQARMIEQICHIEAYRAAQWREHGRELSATEAAREWIARCASRFPGAG